jgi:hypothetical protein
VHYHCVFLEGICLDRTDQNLKPRFVKGEPPSDTDITAVLPKISQRVIRTLRHLGDLQTGRDGDAPTGHDPLRDDAPEFARTLAASVQQRIAFGERAGQKVRRLGAGFGREGEAPTLTGPRCANEQGFSLVEDTALMRYPPIRWLSSAFSSPVLLSLTLSWVVCAVASLAYKVPTNALQDAASSVAARCHASSPWDDQVTEERRIATVCLFFRCSDGLCYARSDPHA